MWPLCTADNPFWLILPFLIGLATGWWAFANGRVRQDVKTGDHGNIASPSRGGGASFSTLGAPYRIANPSEDVRVLDQEEDGKPVPVAGNAPARDGSDNLQRIRGIGPALEIVLNNLGVRRFEQIAAWNEDDVANMRPQLGSFSGRIERDDWIGQARKLAGQ